MKLYCFITIFMERLSYISWRQRHGLSLKSPVLLSDDFSNSTIVLNKEENLGPVFRSEKDRVDFTNLGHGRGRL